MCQSDLITSDTSGLGVFAFPCQWCLRDEIIRTSVFSPPQFEQDLSLSRIEARRLFARRNDVDLEFFDTADGFSYRPRKHWCFLAEIVNIEDFLRLSLTVKDRAGQTTRLMFYNDSRGQEMSPSQLHQGYTLAVLYAEQHGFLDCSVGVRHQDPKYLKVRPASIKPALPLTPCSGFSNRLGGVAQAERSCQEAY